MKSPLCSGYYLQNRLASLSSNAQAQTSLGMAPDQRSPSVPELKLARAPIVEAVLDIECDMSPTFDLASFEERLRDAYKAHYPKRRIQYLEEFRIERTNDQTSTHSAKRQVQAFQFLQDEGKQLVQARTQGFSFNRLAPYSMLDKYLPEIKRTWETFKSIVLPVQIRVVRLRYINRILLPATNGRVDLEQYLRVGPMPPVQDRLRFVGFLNQHAAVEVDTGHQANIVLTSQPPEHNNLPVILDISVASHEAASPEDWDWIMAKVQSLRELKNHIFRSTLTDKCLTLFQPH